MAIQFCDGFDQYATEDDAKKFWTTVLTAMGATLESDTPFNRGKSIKFAHHDAIHNGLGILLPGTAGTVGFACHLKLVERPGADQRRGLIEFLFNGSYQFHFRITSDGCIACYYSGATSNSKSHFITPALPLNEWVHVEGKVVIGISGSVELRINGNVVGTATGVDTQGLSDSLVDQIRIGRQGSTSASGTIMIDNFVLWDTAGVTNNDFLGDVEVYTLLPTADDDTMDWTPSEGSDGYAMIDDEVPDGDDTYISSDTPDAQAVFELDNLPDENMRVLAVQPFVVARKDDSGNRAVKVGIVSGEDTTEASAFSLGTSYAMTSTLYEANPATGLPWEKAEVNALKLSVKVA